MTTNNKIAEAQLEFGKDLALRTQPKDVTEQHIRDAFIKYSGGHAPASFATSYLDFKAGYLALLNKLEVVPNGDPDEVFIPCTLYRLPEGLTKP